MTGVLEPARAARRPGRAWLRPGPAGGLAFVAVLAISFLPGIPPGVGDPDGEVTSWFVAKRSEVLLANYLTGIALFAFAWFLGGVHAALRRAEGPGDGFSAVAIVGGTSFVVTTLIGVALFNAIAFDVAGRGETAVVGGLWDLLHFTFVLGGFGIAMLVGAVAAAAPRIASSPPWFARAGAALAAVWLIAGVALVTDDAVLGAGGVLWGAALVGFSAWVLAVSVLLAREPAGRGGVAGDGGHPRGEAAAPRSRGAR